MNKTCFIELGSNESSDAWIKQAQEFLRLRFPDAVFGRLYRTEPVDFSSPALFYNQSGRFSTTLPKAETARVLKDMEKTMGRSAGDKARGIVKIDIDLLVYNHEILKARDLQRDYVRDGLAELGFRR